MDGERQDPPLFSIGITTYDRPDMLRECVASVLRQTESDFEVLIGNDHQGVPLTKAVLGLDDARIRIVNHPFNLRELGNFNALLAMARGRYFTWQSDDDVYAPGYLAAMRAAFDAFPDASAVYSSFAIIRTLADVPKWDDTEHARIEGMIGVDFLLRHWRGELDTMALTAMYERERLLEAGGIADLVDAPVAAMSEYLLLLKSGMESRVGFIHQPLVMYREHEGSWSMTTRDVVTWETACANYLCEAMRVIRHPSYESDYALHLRRVVQRAFSSVRTVLRRPGARMNLRRESRFVASCTRAVMQGAHRRRITAACVLLHTAALMASLVVADIARAPRADQ